MGMPNFADGIKSKGIPVLGGQGLFTKGESFFLDPVNGNDGFNGKRPDKAFSTLATAYAALTDGAGDVLYYIAGATSLTGLSAKLTWAKSYTHFIGICAPTMIGQRARIFQLSTATGISPLIDITGSGCIFKNLYIFQGVADATSKICVQVTGDRNYFENVHFAGIGNGTMDVADSRSLFLDAAHENRFVNCMIGLDTIDAGSAANAELEFDSESSRNVFDDCIIQRRIEHDTNHPLVKLTDGYGVGSFTQFRNCTFIYTSVNAAYHGTTVFSIPVIASPTRKIILKDCVAVSGNSSAISWDSSSRGILYANMVAAAATAAGGLATTR